MSATTPEDFKEHSKEVFKKRIKDKYLNYLVRKSKAKENRK